MKNYWFLLAFLCQTLWLDGQNVKVTKEIPVGKLSANSRSILADTYEFDGEFPLFQIDTVNNYLFVRSKKEKENRNPSSDKGHLYVIDLPEKKALWNKKVNFGNDYIRYSPQGILYYKYPVTTILDVQTGVKRWARELEGCFFDDRCSLLLGYDYSSFVPSDELKAFDLRTGKKLWQTTLKKRSWVEGIFPANDSVFIIISDGLHWINRKNGSGWHYKAKTSINDPARTTSACALYLFSINTLKKDELDYKIIRLISNPLIKDSSIYFANHQTIARIDFSGRKVWEKKLPGKGSRSLALLKGDSLVLINFGLGQLNRKDVAVGKPYIAYFHKDTGKLISYRLLKNREDSSDDFMAEDYACTDKGISFLFYNGIYSYEFATALLSFKPWDRETHKKLESIYDCAYLFDPDLRTFRKINLRDGKSMLVSNRAGVYFEVNERLEVLGKPNAWEVMFEKCRWKDYTFVGNDYSPLYVIKDHRIVAELTGRNRDIQVFRDKLYMISQEKQIVEIDLNQVFAGIALTI